MQYTNYATQRYVISGNTGSHLTALEVGVSSGVRPAGSVAALTHRRGGPHAWPFPGLSVTGNHNVYSQG